MAKDIAKSIRLSQEVFGFIDNYRGNGFNEKFENIILDYQKEEKVIQDRIKARKKELKLFEKQVSCMADTLRGLQGMKWRVDNCMESLEGIEKNLKALADGVSQK